MAAFSLARGLRVLTLVVGAVTAVLVVFLMLEWFKLVPSLPTTAPQPTPKGAAAVPSPPPVAPAPADDYTLAATASLAHGKGVLTFRVRPAAGKQLNRDLPSELVLTPPPAVQMDATRYRSADFAVLTTETFVVKVPVRQTAAAELPYVFSFGICETENGRMASCTLHKHEATLPLTAP